MFRNCKRSLLLLGALLVGGASPAWAQHEYGENQAPFDVYDQHDFQPFAPAELSEYGDGPEQNEGFFFTWQRMLWSVAPPKEATIGSDTTAFRRGDFGQFLPVNSSLSTGFLTDEAAWGNRWEFGYVVDDEGLMFNYTGRFRQTQVNRLNGVTVLFDDPSDTLIGFGDINGDGIDDNLDGDNVFGRSGADTDFDGIPDTAAFADLGDRSFQTPIFDNVFIYNLVEVGGVEISKIYRWEPLHNGATVELIVGARVLEVDDTFRFEGVGGPLDDTEFDHKVDNHIIGPQIGLRYARRTGRWTFSGEGRFTPGVNFREVRQEGEIGTNADLITSTAPENFRPLAFKNSASDEQFSPIGEIRLDAAYQVTKGFSIKGGYTLLAVGGVGRASNSIDYSLENMGIRDFGYGEDFRMNGFNLGVEFNR